MVGTTSGCKADSTFTLGEAEKYAENLEGSTFLQRLKNSKKKEVRC